MPFGIPPSGWECLERWGLGGNGWALSVVRRGEPWTLSLENERDETAFVYVRAPG
jgi:hypothetical protein